jgi:hypothetical protein
MQLVEQGKLDLDQEIETYLDFKIPRKFPAKITLRHLLTHTAGFEETFKSLPADSGKGVPLRDAVSKKIPAQLYPPGTVTSYSNYGADLAGYIVERVSGTPFPEYIRLHILEPLGMTHSSIAEPLPAWHRAHVSEGYAVASDTAKPFEILQGEPSGNMSSTGVDMAKFAIAHLQLGRYGDQRILKEETARLMATTQFRTHPDINGMGLGFFEENRNGYRIIGHGGDLSYFHSHFSLLMDEGVGFFVSVNSAGSGGNYGVREAVRDAFLDRYFPRRIPLEPVAADAREEAQKVAGEYIISRRSESTLGKVAAFLISLDIAPSADGSISVPFLTGPSGKPIKWYPIGRHLVFRTDDGSDYVGFVTDSSGQVTRMGWIGGHELHRAPFADHRSFNRFVLVGSVGVFVATLLLWPIAGLLRRRYRQPLPADGVSRRLRALTRWVSLTNVVFLVAIVLFMLLGFNEVIKLDRRTDPLLAVIRIVGLLGAIGTLVALAACFHTWRDGTSGWARFKYTALAVACIGFTWFIVHWNLLSWNFNY